MDDERFITEVQNRPILYDSSHRFYKDNTRKDKAWSEVGEAVGYNAGDCKSRWRQFRDSFVKHKKRNSLSKDSGQGSQKEWKYAELMAFLTPFLQPTRSVSNPMPTSGAGEDERPETQLPLVSSAPSPIPPLSMSPSSPESERVVRSRSPRDRAQLPGMETTWKSTQVLDLEDRLMGVLQEPPTKPKVPNTEQDEAYHFALSTVPLLLNLNKTRRRQAKREIMKVLDLLNEEEEKEQVVTIEYI